MKDSGLFQTISENFLNEWADLDLDDPDLYDLDLCYVCSITDSNRALIFSTLCSMIYK